jgi:two-component system sensor kinase FixL
MANGQRRFAIEAGLTEASASQALMSSVLDAAAQGILVVDGCAHILIFNKACERLFGYPAVEMVGRSVDAIFPTDGGAGGAAHAGDAARFDIGRMTGAEHQVSGRHRDGTMLPIELSVGEAAAAQDRIFVAILRDLRPRNEAEQRMARLQGDLMRIQRILAMDEMGAALAHEVNQPLTALMLYLQAVERAAANLPGGSAFSQAALDILDKAVGEAERVGQIVQRMRQFTEKHDPERRLIDLNPLVADAVDFALIGVKASTRVARTLSPHLPRVLVDPLQVQQIVVNLMRNALGPSSASGGFEIRVATRREPDHIVVVIEDDGPGIPPDIFPDLFKPFSGRVVEGLGLAISRTIAQNHGGGLHVDPGGDGSGARYTLRLPLPPDAGT